MRTASSLVAALVLSLERDGVVCLYREDQARDQAGRFAEEGATGGGGAERRRSDPDAAVRAASAIEHGKNATFADLERALGRPPTGRERSIFRNVIKARGGRVVADAPAEEAPAEPVTSPQDAPAPPEAPEAAPAPAEPPAPEPTAPAPPPGITLVEPDIPLDRARSAGLASNVVARELTATESLALAEAIADHASARQSIRDGILARVEAAKRGELDRGAEGIAGLSVDRLDDALAEFEAKGGSFVRMATRARLLDAELQNDPTKERDFARSSNGLVTPRNTLSQESVPQLAIPGLTPWPARSSDTHPITVILALRARREVGAPGVFAKGYAVGNTSLEPRDVAVSNNEWTTARVDAAIPRAPADPALLADTPRTTGAISPAWDPRDLAGPVPVERVSPWEQGADERRILGLIGGRLLTGADDAEQTARAARLADRLVEHARVYVDQRIAEREEQALRPGNGADVYSYDFKLPDKDGPALGTYGMTAEGRKIALVQSRERPNHVLGDPALLRSLGLTSQADAIASVFADGARRWEETGGMLRDAVESVRKNYHGRIDPQQYREMVLTEVEERRRSAERWDAVRSDAAAAPKLPTHGLAQAQASAERALVEEGTSDYERAAAVRRVERTAGSMRYEVASSILAAKPETTSAKVRLVRQWEAAQSATAPAPPEWRAPRGIKDPPRVSATRAGLAASATVTPTGVRLPMRDLDAWAKAASAELGRAEGALAVFDIPTEHGTSYQIGIAPLRRAIEVIRRLPDATAEIGQVDGKTSLVFRWRNSSAPKERGQTGRLILYPSETPTGKQIRVASVPVGEPGAVTASAEIPDREWWLDALALARDGLLDDRALHVPRSASYVPDAVHVPTLVQLSADRLAQAVPLPLSSVQGDDGPKWVQLAYAGTWKGHAAAKSFSFDREAFEKMVENFRADPRFDGGNSDVVAFDFNHASEMHPSQLSDKGAPAQAWLQDVEVRNGPGGEPQLWGKVRYLPLARQYVRGGQYRYLSIAFTPDGRHLVSGKRIGPQIKSVAFTNDPFLRGLAPLVASADSPPVPTRDDEADMSTTIARLISVFALAATATEDDVIRAAEANVKELKDRRDVEAKQAVAVVCSAYGFDAERDAPTLLAAYTSDPEAFAKRYPVEGTRAAKRKLAPVVALEQRVVSGASRRAAPVTALGAGAAEDERDEDDLPAGFKLSAYPGRNATERCLAAVDADPAWKGRPYDERFERARALKRAAERAGQC